MNHLQIQLGSWLQLPEMQVTIGLPDKKYASLQTTTASLFSLYIVPNFAVLYCMMEFGTDALLQPATIQTVKLVGFDCGFQFTKIITNTLTNGRPIA